MLTFQCQNTFKSCSSRLQMAPVDDSEPLPPKGIRRVQSIVGSILYYARALNSIMLPALNDIGSKQAAATTDTTKQCTMLLNYAATYPNAKIRFCASDMTNLQAGSDAAYLVLPHARSCYAGCFFLRTPESTNGRLLNGSILVVCKSIRSVVASAAEAETAGGLFYNGQDAIIIRHSLEALGHPQPKTPIETDNSTATGGFIYDNIRQRKSKTWDMRWNWLRDEKTHDVLNYYWDAGKNNNADYFTKHNAPKHHREMRPMYILQGHNVATFTPLLQRCSAVPSHAQGCVFFPGRYKPLPPPMATSVIPKSDRWR